MKSTIYEPSPLHKAQLDELKRILHFINCHPEAAGYFEKNGSRALYSKFKEKQSVEAVIHQLCHHFISLHIPLAQTEGPPGPPVSSSIKSSLKQKEYEIKLQESDLLTAKQKDYFTTEVTRLQLKKRKDHIDRILES